MFRTLSIIAVLSCSLAGAATPVKLTSTTQPIGRISIESTKFGAAFSNDQRHSVLFVMDGHRVSAIHDGKPEGTYDWVIPGSAIFSVDNSTLVYIAQTGAEMFLVVNGKPLKSYYEILAPFRLSEDGKHVAYIARDKDGQPFVVFDEHPDQPAAKIPVLTMSRDGSRIAYTTEHDGVQQLIDNTGPLPLGDGKMSFALPHFSPDGKHLTCAYGVGKQEFISVDGKSFGPFDAVAKNSPLYSPDSAHWLSSMKVGDKVQLMKDGQVIDTADAITAPTFSPDSQHLVYLTRNDDKDTVIRDGAKFATYDTDDHVANFFCFSPDNKRLVYAVLHGKDEQRIVIDGKDQKPWIRVGEPFFSPDSAHVVYAFNIAKDQTRIMLDDTPMSETIYKAIDGKSLRFSPDGKHLAYFAADPNGTPGVYVDDVRGPAFKVDLADGQILFDDNTTLRFTAGEEDFRINSYTVTISP